MTTLTDKLFTLVFTLAGVIVLNYGAATIQFSKYDDAGLFMLVAGLAMLVVSSVELHKLTK